MKIFITSAKITIAPYQTSLQSYDQLLVINTCNNIDVIDFVENDLAISKLE